MGARFSRIVMVAWFAAVFLGSAEAAESCKNTVGRFVSIEGAVEVAHADQNDWHPASMDSSLCGEDSVRVGANSRAAVALANDAVLRLDQNTTMRLVDVAEKPEQRSFLELVSGAFKSFSRAPRTLTVHTPYVNGMIEGTEFAMRVDGDSTLVTVYEGKVNTANDKGSLALTRGESALAQAGNAPRPYLLAKPRDAVQWTLYYPPVLATGSGTGDLSSATREALRLSNTGKTAAGLAVLEQRTPESYRDSAFHSFRAALLLNIGRVQEARAEIDAALVQDPRASLAYALRSIIGVVQNERENALADARKSVDLSPSAAARIALSYAQQASFQVEAARDTLVVAIREHPDDALAWSRLGELWLMIGDRQKALAAARKAGELAPNEPGAQLTRGFAALAEFRNDEARVAFEQAIRLRSADPIAHLGLGLARISDGDLAAGRRELEAAVALDSSNALLRAYLGKAYFEEKRYPLDNQQYGIAKELDSKDPTAYLYDGILKQTINRPVEALHDLQDSIEKNDNRAVYRSRMLLDQDRAARGTSIARVYNDLGFTQLGINEAGKSLALDPSADSAHRFLSDTYRAGRRTETARVSELLQAQMLQDINVNPVQPSLSETNLNIVTRGGATDAGFNEFTPLFERNTARLNATGIFGNRDTIGGEGVVSAIYDRLSLSAGAFSYDTNGWRSNNDLTHKVYNVFTQVAVTPELNVQGEYRHRESQYGDLGFSFSRDDYQPNSRNSLNQDTARLGLRYSPSAHSDFLVSYIHGGRDEGNRNSGFEPLLAADFLTRFKGQANANQIEAQYIYKHDFFNVLTGFGYTRIDNSLRPNSSVDFGFFNVDSTFTETVATNDYRGYVYTNINYPRSAIWTLGLSVVSYEDNEKNQLAVTFAPPPFPPLQVSSSSSNGFKKVNPKFGVQWDVLDNLRFRGFYTQGVKPPLVANRTLEPTQLAGFVQYFDDPNATQSERYGVGLTWQALRDLAIGGEATWRHIKQPAMLADPTVGPTVWMQDPIHEMIHQFFIYWTPTDQLTVRTAFTYDTFRRQSDDLSIRLGNQDPQSVQTISVPVSASYFHPTGLFASAGVTYVNQNVEKLPQFSSQGHDGFSVVDLGIGFRFPKRLGIASFQVLNLFDEHFNYQDDTYREFSSEPLVGPYFPSRTLLGRVTFNF